MAYRIYILFISLISSLGLLMNPYWPTDRLRLKADSIPVSQVNASIKLSSTPLPLISETAEQERISTVAKQAYLWGWPLVYLHNCKQALENVPAPGCSGGMPVAPPNYICMLSNYVSPHATAVPCPNQDVLYGFGMLDLEQDSVVLQVPDFGERFWLIQLGDQRTDSFAKLGKMYDTKAGMYLIVGPDWDGDKPEGFVDILRCPTRIGFCLPRIYSEASMQESDSLTALINRVAVYPFDEYTGRWKTCDWSKSRWLPSLGVNERSRSKWVRPDCYFETLAEVIESVPPLPGEEELYEDIKQLLLNAQNDDRMRQQLTEIAHQAEQEMISPLFDFRNFGQQLPGFWTTISNGAAFGTDYLTRTAVAKSNIFVNRREETLYYYQERDSAGKLLQGTEQYTITFPSHQIPQVKGFWSLTVYNDKHAFHKNAHDRYSLGSKSQQMRFNLDGSLTIYLQATPPSSEQYENWLPTPAGNYSLYLRTYWPDEAMLRGEWTPPAVTTAGSLSVAKYSYRHR